MADRQRPDGLSAEMHDALLGAVDESITMTVASIQKNGGTTSRWSLLIFDPVVEDMETDWGPKLMCNGKVVLHMPSSELAQNLARYWRLDISADAAEALAAPTPEGVLRCVTVVGGVARPMEMHVPTLAPGGDA